MLLTMGRRAGAMEKLARAEMLRPLLKPVIEQMRNVESAPVRIQLVD